MTLWKIVIAVLVATVADARVARSQDPAVVQAAVSDLRSPNPSTRMEAFEALRRTAGALRAPQVQSILVELLERENDLIASTWHESNGTRGIVDVYGEDFAEYVSALASECMAHCDPREPRALRALATVFPGDSPQTLRLAERFGSQMLPLAMEKAGSTWSDEQRDGLDMLGTIGGVSRTLSSTEAAQIDSALTACLATTCKPLVAQEAATAIGALVERNGTLSPGRRAALHRAIIASTSDRNELIRTQSVEALGYFRDTADVALLERLRSRDASPSVTAQARRAIQRIKAP